MENEELLNEITDSLKGCFGGDEEFAQHPFDVKRAKDVYARATNELQMNPEQFADFAKGYARLKITNNVELLERAEEQIDEFVAGAK